MGNLFAGTFAGSAGSKERENKGALGCLQGLYNDPRQSIAVRMRPAIECLPFENPKLSATAVLTSDDFASRLERAILRSGMASTVIEHETKEPKPLELADASAQGKD